MQVVKLTRKTANRPATSKTYKIHLNLLTGSDLRTKLHVKPDEDLFSCDVQGHVMTECGPITDEEIIVVEYAREFYAAPKGGTT